MTKAQAQTGKDHKNINEQVDEILIRSTINAIVVVLIFWLLILITIGYQHVKKTDKEQKGALLVLHVYYFKMKS